MTQTFMVRFALVCAATAVTLCVFALPAYADHGDEPEESHATTVHADEVEVSASGPVTATVTYAPTIDVAKITTMQELLKALQQLLVLLEQQKTIVEHDATPHTHDDEHDEEETDDEDDNHDEDHA